MPTQNNNWDASFNGPAQRAEAVTPADSTDLTDVARGFYVGVGGDVKVTMLGGVDMLYGGMLAGQYYPFAITKVFSGTTTAASIVAVR